jgi:hypothetical protein
LEIMMKRLTLAAAKTIVEQSKILLPLLYLRDMLNIAHAYSVITTAFAAMKNLKTEEEAKAALAAIKEMQAALPSSIQEARSLSASALVQIKKLAHTSDDGKRKAIHLAPRRLRREAARIVAKEDRRLERERQAQVGQAA